MLINRKRDSIVKAVSFSSCFSKALIGVFILLELISLLSIKIVKLPFRLFKIVFLRVKLFVIFVPEPTSKSQSKMQGGLFLYIIIAEKLTVLQLLSCKDNKLTIRRSSLFVDDLSFYILNRVGGFNIYSDGLLC